MGIFQNNLLAGAAAAASAGGGGFYDYQIEQSARFDLASTSYMERDSSSQTPTNRDKHTLSVWVKRVTTQGTTGGGGTANQSILTTVGNSANWGYQFSHDSSEDDRLKSGFASIGNLVSSNKLRDTGGWYHLLFRYDSTDGTASNRMLQYVNGTVVSSFAASTYPSQNADSYLGSGTVRVGRAAWANDYADQYMAEMIFIDGLSLAPSNFATSKNGVWVPVDASGLTFGTIGFHLKFENSGDLGNDSSGNNNDFTASNMGPDHQVLDSPTFGS